MGNKLNQWTAGQWIGRAVAAGIATAVAAFGCVPAFAQQASKLSNIDRRIEQREIVEPAPPAEPMEIPAMPAPDPGAWRAKPFVLGGVVIDGATVFTVERFTESYEDFLARKVTADDIETILQRITRIYRDSGYFLARVIAPKQSVRAGVVRLRIIEGYIARVSIGDDYPGREVIDRYARAVLAQRPARLETVERMLLFTKDLPGVSVVPTVQPVDKREGRYELRLNLKYKPVSASVQLDNLGTPDVGRLQGLVTGSLNAPFGLGERLHATFITVPDQPKELLYGSLEAMVPVGANGARVSLLGALSAVDAGGEKSAFDTESDSKQLIGRFRYPLIRTRSRTFWLTGTLDFRDFEETEQGQLVIRDRSRVVRAGARYVARDALRGMNSVSLELSQGLGFLGASERGSSTLSRPDGHSDFTKLAARMVRRQPLTDRIEVKVSFMGQLAADPLLSYEEFSLGGEVIGRGYDFSEISGEHGVASSLELRYTKPSNLSWLDQYQLYSFLDGGVIWDKSMGRSFKRDRLASAGIGVRLQVLDCGHAAFEAAKPLTRAVETRGDDDWVAFFTLGLRY